MTRPRIPGRRGTPRRPGARARWVAARGRPDRGMVTAEAAVVLPALLLTLLACLWLVGAGAAAVRCGDAAREAARVAARGDGSAVARQVATAVAPAGARVVIETGAGRVVVTVEAARSAPGPLGRLLPPVRLRATTTAAAEAAAAPEDGLLATPGLQ